MSERVERSGDTMQIFAQGMSTVFSMRQIGYRKTNNLTRLGLPHLWARQEPWITCDQKTQCGLEINRLRYSTAASGKALMRLVSNA